MRLNVLNVVTVVTHSRLTLRFAARVHVIQTRASTVACAERDGVYRAALPRAHLETEVKPASRSPQAAAAEGRGDCTESLDPRSKFLWNLLHQTVPTPPRGQQVVP